MKKSIIICLGFYFLFFCQRLHAQSIAYSSDTLNNAFDNVSDNFGTKHNINDIALSSSKSIGSGSTVQLTGAPTQDCTAGYFRLFFAPNSIFTGSLAAQTQSIVCELFSNLSGLINSPLALSTNTTKVNIYCGATTAPGAQGSPFYVFASFPTNPNQGILDNQVFKTIVSGVDAYSLVPTSAIYNTNGQFNTFYHGYLNVNETILWNLSTSTSTINSNEFDLYTALLHEATHILGFISLVNYNGNSVLGSANNYYTRFDTYLKNNSLNSFLASSSTACASSSLAFVTSTSAICNATASCGVFTTNCGNAAKYASPSTTVSVFTPSCYTLGSSLSHFEDMCSYPSSFTSACTPTPATPGYNDMYFVMTDGISPSNCFIKRYLKEEERHVLCDIGYSVNSTYTSNVAAASHTYATSSCSGTDIWGLNDGFNGSIYTYTTTGTSISISTLAIIANDATTTAQMSCIEVVYTNTNTNFAFTTSGSSITVTGNAGTGLCILKYYPKNSSGNLGNITYIFVYFSPSGCNGSSSCNMVQNGGFENLNYGIGCGIYYGTNYLYENQNTAYYSVGSCWDNYEGSPDLYTRNCNSVPARDLGNSTHGTLPPMDSYNGSPNNRVLGCVTATQTFAGNTQFVTEVAKNNLSSPLIPNNSYQISLLINNNSGSVFNAGNKPLVLSVASLPSFNSPSGSNFPAGLNIIAEFTVPASTNSNTPWSAVTQTFVFNPNASINHNAILIGPNAIKTASFSGGDALYAFIDEVYLQPFPIATFSIPNATMCGNSSFTNLAQYASVTGTFSGTGVTYSSGQYNFNSYGTLLPGTYIIAFSYTNSSGCLNTLFQNVKITPNYSLTLTPSSTICLNNNTITLTGLISPTNTTMAYLWQPSNLTTSAIVVSPTNSTTYSLTATDNANNCSATQTVAINITTNCCNSIPMQTFTPTVISSAMNISGPILVNHDFTIQAGGNVWFLGEVRFTNDVKVTIDAGGQALIYSAHLLACENDMWHGFLVNNGGNIVATNIGNPIYGNLIEDAIVAIDIPNSNTITSSNILKIDNTIFNKNYIDISISNYTYTSGTPFNISNCVFTCRNLPFTTVAWPQTGTLSSAATSSADLRYATTATTGLVAPYLGQSNFTITNLKNPYPNQPSHIALKLNSVGITTGTNAYSFELGISTATTVNNFNLFDAHGKFIEAANTNLIFNENVFQNTQRYQVPISGGSSITTSFGGQAIDVSITPTMIASLAFASTPSLVNKFWECHTALSAKNVYQLNIENTIFRSTQSTLSLPSGTFIPVGNKGINLSTNRFMYYIRGNEFTNIADVINIPISWDALPSAMMPSGSSYAGGIYAANISILQNTFSPVITGTNIGYNYSNQAINISCPNNWPTFLAPSYLVSPLIIGADISYNKIKNTFRGIHFNGLSGFKTTIANNDITLRDDILNTNFPQSGIELQNHLGSNNLFSQSCITNNTLTGQNTTNTLVSLVDCAINTGLLSPSVTCNYLSNSGNGFLFNNTNSLSVWQGNEMTNLGRGLVLDNNGKIGQQGDINTASNNKWLGSAWTGTNYSTLYIDPTNTVVNTSTLYIKNSANLIPTNNFGISNFSDWYSIVFNKLKVSTGGDYQCGDFPNNFVVPLPNQNDYSIEDYYIAQVAFYRFLHHNDSVRNSGSNYLSFYSNLQTSNIGMFNDVEEKLFQGDFTQASIVNNVINPNNSIENNYQLYYNLYIKYYTAGTWNVDDSTDLYTLAYLCPGDYGACVLQARALYNSIYNSPFNYPLCGAAGNKSLNTTSTNQIENSTEWIIDLYPNPNWGNFAIISKPEKEKLEIKISDAKGAIVFHKLIETNKNVYVLDLSLTNGFYLVTIKNEKGQSLTKKMAVNK